MARNGALGDALYVERPLFGHLSPFVDCNVTDPEKLRESGDATNDIGGAADDGEESLGGAIGHCGTEDNLRFRNLSTSFPYHLIDGLLQCPFMQTFTERLDWAMGRRRLSREKLAQAVGVSREAIGKWLNKGGLPQSHRWAKLAETLGVSLAWLRDGSGDPDALKGGIDSPRTLDPRVEALASAVKNAAAAGEFALAANAAELLALAYRDLDARKKGAPDKNVEPGRKRG
jgi:transcriptional regulator with XRE-family HTH domain